MHSRLRVRRAFRPAVPSGDWEVAQTSGLENLLDIKRALQILTARPDAPKQGA
jgi:hypothetical protein